MRKTDLAELFARRLGADPGRVTSIFARATESGILPKASGRDVPQLNDREIATALIAVVADEGLGSVTRAVGRYGSMKCSRLGETLENAVANLLSEATSFHVLAMSQLVIFRDKDAPAAILTCVSSEGPQTAIFLHGDPASAASKIKGAQTTIRIDGAALAGIALELRGTEKSAADGALVMVREHRWRQATAAASAGHWTAKDAALMLPPGVR